MAKTRRKSKRSWMQDDKYLLGFNHGGHSVSFNMAETFERMCKSKRWKHALLAGVEDHKREMGYDPKFRVTVVHQRNGYASHCDRTMQRIMQNTMQCRGVRRNSAGPIYSVHPGRTSYGGREYGASVATDYRSSLDSVARKMVTILHELTHYMHLRTVYPNVIEGVERCHDRMFNAMMCDMARHFWGYDRSPMMAGYSVGRGYAPTKHLTKWMTDRLTQELEGKQDKRVMGWIDYK